MLLKIEEDGQCHMIECRGPVIYGTSAQKTLRKIQSRSERIFQTRPTRSASAASHVWTECKPQVLLHQSDYDADATHYYPWAQYKDAEDGRIHLVVFSSGYLMNDHGRTIETIR